jgi:hypothetical protein
VSFQTARALAETVFVIQATLEDIKPGRTGYATSESQERMFGFNPLVDLSVLTKYINCKISRSSPRIFMVL